VGGIATLRLIAAAGLLLAAAVSGAAAQQPAAPASDAAAPAGGGDVPILFRADRVDHDRELGIVIATGHVEMTQGKRVLLADTVSYNQRRDLVTATGNVSMLEPSGDVIFADHVELTGDFREGIIENIRVLLADDSRLAAAGGRRSGGNIMDMRKAVYTPCRTCVKRSSGTPIWQIKAVKVVHNQEEKIIEYTDAFMEFFGVPVAYTPYLSHPDPTVKRKSGLLTPRYGVDSEFGALVEVPYYWNIAPDKDATFRPIITGNEGVALAAEYRQRFADGTMVLQGSGTYASKADGTEGARGHFYADADYELNETWRTGAKVRYASDDTYLQRYKFDGTDTLENRLFVEGFRRRNYSSLESYYWRGLRSSDDSSTTPIVVPLANYSFVGEPGAGGGRWEMDANMLVLTRTGGTDSRRLSVRSGWRRPHISDGGHVYTLWGNVQTDAYLVDEVAEPGKAASDTYDGFAGRVFPRIGADWRFPFARQGHKHTQVLEPIAGIALSPNGGNSGRIPNEDSQDFDFDDTNLLSENSFTGRDRVEGGQRVYYGMRVGLYGASGGSSSVFIGQSYRLRTDDTFEAGSGLEDNLSDIVGRVKIRPGKWVELDYRFRLDTKNFSAHRNEVTFSVGVDALRLSGNYLFIDDGTATDEFSAREEINATLASYITQEWRVSAGTRHNLETGRTLSHSFELAYVCDCLTATLQFTRTFTEDRDVRPSDTILLRLEFKNLGQVETRN
jgi:LPS-assembly protein